MNTACLIELGRRFFGRAAEVSTEDVAEVEEQLAANDLELEPDMRAILDAAQQHERAGPDERHPRRVVRLCDAGHSFLLEDAPKVLAARFGLNASQAETAASYLRKALRRRRREQRRGQGFVNAWKGGL